MMDSENRPSQDESRPGRVPSKGPGQPAFDITEEMLFKFLKDGLTVAQMACELHVSKSTIKRRLSVFNISTRKPPTDTSKEVDDSCSVDASGPCDAEEGMLNIKELRGVTETEQLQSNDIAPSVFEHSENYANADPGSSCVANKAGFIRKGQHRGISAAELLGTDTEDGICGAEENNEQQATGRGQHVISPGGARVQDDSCLPPRRYAREGYYDLQILSPQSQAVSSLTALSISSPAERSEPELHAYDNIEIQEPFTKIIPELEDEIEKYLCLQPEEIEHEKAALIRISESAYI
ncbi:uncharacterized protein [Littorina saxatilis]|uniref:Uncharacterized protein n=1 Tax=Littorina saxatilis TaxID=31220 RepID=A0AAN9FZR7_9CAEN